MGNLWENSIKQKQDRMPVIPVVLYHGKKAWSPGTLISRFKNLPDSVRPFIPDFEFVFVDLSAYSNDFIKNRIFELASLRIALLIMKNIFDPKGLERHLTQFLEIGRSYFQEEQGLKFLEAVVNYILQATEIETDKLVKSIAGITEKGSEMANLDIALIRKILNNEPVDIPLHLLPDNE